MQKTNQFDTTNFFKNYANFTGRTTRADFWFFQEVIFVISSFISALTYFLESNIGMYSLFSVISIGFSLFTFIPSLAISVRRLHDIGKSGYWLLPGVIMPFILLSAFPFILFAIIFTNSTILISSILVLLVLIYTLVLLIFFLMPSQKSKNRYDVESNIETQK